MIYSSDTTIKNIERAKTFALNPSPKVQLSPVPFVLLQVASVRGDGEQVAFVSRHCATDYGDYAGVMFDNWHKGDLCVIRVNSSYHTADTKCHESHTWHIAKRASLPSAVRHKFDCSGSRPVTTADNMTLFRIPYRYLHNATKLFGQSFDTRDALEAALTQPVQSFAIAAE